MAFALFSVGRNFYARKRGMAASTRLHICGFVCIGMRLRATTNTVVAMSRLTATWRCRVRAAPWLRRAARPRHRQPCGFHRPAGHERDLRRTQIITNRWNARCKT